MWPWAITWWDSPPINQRDIHGRSGGKRDGAGVYPLEAPWRALVAGPKIAQILAPLPRGKAKTDETKAAEKEANKRDLKTMKATVQRLTGEINSLLGRAGAVW